MALFFNRKAAKTEYLIFKAKAVRRRYSIEDITHKQLSFVSLIKTKRKQLLGSAVWFQHLIELSPPIATDKFSQANFG